MIECNKKVVDYLDVTLNLNDGTFKPYRKPDSNLQYINTDSNHPPNIIRQLPLTIEKRLSEHSSNEEIFNNAKADYEKALKDSGYQPALKFTPHVDEISQRRNRKRNIIWFNPPFSKNVSTNIARRFLNLINKHFPRNHKFSKLFNRNNVKVSYSCTPNVKNIIDSHNKNVLKNQTEGEERACNCRIKDQCPLNGECLAKNIIYEAEITTNNINDEPLKYIGLTGNTFKERFSNHKSSFKNEKYGKDTELSKMVWKLKRDNKQPKVTWKIIHHCAPINRNSLRCNLCLNEKLEIALTKSNDNESIINSRSELVSKCRHINKFTLMRYDSKD